MTRTAKAAAATVTVRIPVPLLRRHLVQAPTTPVACLTESEHV